MHVQMLVLARRELDIACHLFECLEHMMRSEEIECRVHEGQVRYPESTVLTVDFGQPPRQHVIESIFDKVHREYGRGSCLFVVGGRIENIPKSFLLEFRDGILIDGEVAKIWEATDPSSSYVGVCADPLLFYREPRKEISGEGSSAKHEAIERLRQMRSLPHAEQNGRVEPQEVRIVVPEDATLDELAEVAYEDVCVISNEQRGVGGKNVLLITSIERSREWWGQLDRHPDSPDGVAFTFLNSAACGLRCVPAQEGGRTLGDRLMDGKVRLLWAIGGPKGGDHELRARCATEE